LGFDIEGDIKGQWFSVDVHGTIRPHKFNTAGLYKQLKIKKTHYKSGNGMG